MADNLQTLALITLAQNYAGDIVRQINRCSVLLKTLKIVPGEGKNVAWVAEKDGALAESYMEGADAVNFGSDGQSSAILPWSMYRSNFHVSGLAQATAATSKTPVGNVDLWKRNMINAATSLSSKINADLYIGVAAPDLTGLGEAIGDDANIYAAIDRSTNAFWRPYVVDPGAPTAITFDQIRLDLSTIYVQSSMRPDLAFVSPSVLRKIAGLFDPQKQYVFVTEGMSSKGKFHLEGGQGAVQFDGCLFIEDKDCPESTIFYVNSEKVEIEYLPFDMSVLGMDDETMEMLATDGLDPIMLMLRMEMIAKLGDSDRAQVKAYLQLKAEQPNSCGVRLNVSIA